VAQGAHGSSTLSAGGPEADFFRGIARVGLQVADALAYAHRQGILHRDIKPSNLLLDRQGTVWVTDFGLAKAEGADDLTQTGDIVGTIRFMAPERFEGKSLPQSDVYSLGVTLYELLTLRPAFDHTNKAKLIEEVVHEPPQPPRKFDPRIPRDLETVVLKCLAKDPRERYATPEALADDLRRFLADRPIKARRATAREHLWRWCRRNPALATLSGALLLLLVVSAVGGVTMSVQLNSALGQARDDRDKARDAVRQGKIQLFKSLAADARARRFSGRVGQRFGTLESIRKAVALARELDKPAETFAELRDLAIAALALPDVRVLKELEVAPEGTRVWGLDGVSLRLYARVDGQGTVTVRRVEDDAEVARLEGQGGKWDWIFIPDDRSLLCRDGADGWLKRWTFSDPRPVKIVATGGGICRAELTADGRRLMLMHRGEGYKVVEVFDLPLGRRRFQRRIAIDDEPRTWSTALDPRGRFLAACEGRYGTPERTQIQVIEIDTGQVVARLPHPSDTYAPAWHPDGRTLAVGIVNTNEVYLWNVPAQKVLSILRDQKGGEPLLGMSRSGQMLASTSAWGGGLLLWHPHTGRPLVRWPGGMWIQLTNATADGRLYASSSPRGGRLELHTAEPSPVLRMLVRDPVRGPFQQCGRAAVHPGGRLLAVGTSDGVTLFDLAAGLDIGRLDLGINFGVRFDPATGDLLTYGIMGLVRWRVRLAADAAGPVQIGQPRRLLLPAGGGGEFDLSRDGKVIVLTSFPHAFILHGDGSKPPLLLGSLGDVRKAAVSPDGRWVALGGHESGGITIWEAATGRQVKKLLDSNGAVRFSPDGRWLFTESGGARQLWHAGTWEHATEFERSGLGGHAFSPDSKLLVAERGDGAVGLFSTVTGRTLAVLENPEQGRAGAAAFSPDGTRLVLSSRDHTTVDVWDLRELRKRLRELDLDWAADPYPPATQPADLSLSPLEVKIDECGLAGLTQKRQTAIGLNNEAWLLATGAPEKRDPARALQLIQQALRDDPDNPTFLNTLGVVQYRNGQHAQALVTLEKSLAAGKGKSDGFDLFFLAMCHARLGDATKAKDCRDRAVKWVAAQKNLPAQHQAELKAFRTEAETELRAP
jgi:WD40 repeat protein